MEKQFVDETVTVQGTDYQVSGHVQLVHGGSYEWDDFGPRIEIGQDIVHIEDDELFNKLAHTAIDQWSRKDKIRVIVNPWTGAEVEFDCSEVTKDQVTHYANLMSEEEIERVNDRLEEIDEWDSASEALAAWIDIVGPDRAGHVILGS